jgi:predicted porin
LGAVTLTAPDSWGWFKGASLTAGVVNTAGANGGANYYVGTSLPTPWTPLKFGTAFDYVDEHSNGFNPHNDSVWVAGVYATYQVTDKLSLNGRGEYVNGQPAGAHATDNIYFQSDGYELTLDVQYNLWANVLSRVEVRWDHADHGFPFASPGTAEANAYMFAMNLVYQF